MKQFDEKFSRKAKEAFDNYNADHLAGEGWNSFTAKYGRNRRRAVVFPLWAKAASLAVLVTLGVLFTSRIIDQKAGEPVSQTAKENGTGAAEPAINKVDSSAAATVIVNPVIVNPVQSAEATTITAGQSPQADVEKSGYEFRKAAGTLLAETVMAGRSSGAEPPKAGGSLRPDTSSAAGLLLSENGIAAGVSAWTDLPDNPAELRLTDDADAGLKLFPKKALDKLIDLPREKMTTTLMTGLSGMMASIDNTASNAQGVSLGFYVEQQLTRRISVRPGLAMAKHSYAMESTAGGNMALDYAAPELNGMSGTTTSYEADIEVLSMEVPVNFVFSLRKRSGSNLFVTTGASTVIYLNQHLSGNFNNTYTRATVDNSTGEVSYEKMDTSVKIESRQESLNRVDFLGLANFSAGYSFPFAKTSHFVFEPFIQLPVKDLTSMNLRIRYGGLSMKLQF
jgi:hypothetical protein